LQFTQFVPEKQWQNSAFCSFSPRTRDRSNSMSICENCHSKWYDI